MAPARAGAGWEKGRVGNNVRDARHRLWHGAPALPTLAALNDWLATRCVALWVETAHPEHSERTIAELWEEEEKGELTAGPPKPSTSSGMPR